MSTRTFIVNDPLKAFFRLGFTPPPSSRSLFLEFRRATLFFTDVRLFLVYFALASRSKVFFDLPSLLVTRDAIYERLLTQHSLEGFFLSRSPFVIRDHPQLMSVGHFDF